MIMMGNWDVCRAKTLPNASPELLFMLAVTNLSVDRLEYNFGGVYLAPFNNVSKH